MSKVEEDKAIEEEPNELESNYLELIVFKTGVFFKKINSGISVNGGKIYYLSNEKDELKELDRDVVATKYSKGISGLRFYIKGKSAIIINKYLNYLLDNKCIMKKEDFIGSILSLADEK